ncbi:uncharacterized protein LOC119405848 [Rhipicephalus sanguineus]|uniref:uncharacterized protein LOC119405848 n=1 Tax=Rhipicephalus sanguineus TaxID=34632 RepID=UPI0020C3CD4B|nr:uncharacterized protein LOC119405848 [Rhipicephalus sanguineus]
MAHQQLPDFDDEKDSWKPYVIKAEAYFEATGVTESAKKWALLMAALSTRTVQILAGRIAPKKPNSLEYEDVVKALDEFFDPKRHEIAESFRFFNCCQLDGESPPTARLSTSTQILSDIIYEFPDVFSSELGLNKGPAAHLQLKEGVTPKFYHQPLLGLLRSDRPTPPLAAARIQRWALYLGGFRYKLQYYPGKSGESDEWTLAPDANVYIRNFGKGEKWKTGTVQSADGARMVRVETPDGLVWRHVDQVHTRRDSVEPQRDREGESMPKSRTTQETPGSGPSAKAELRQSPHQLQSSSPTQDQEKQKTREPTLTTELRRSTRQRKPVQRLQYY